VKANEKIRVVIAADYKLLRECLHLALEDDEKIEIAGETENGIPAINMISTLKPDVVLLNNRLGEVEGIEILNSIKRNNHEAKVLLLPNTCDEATLLSAFKHGADGSLSKNTSIDVLITAIRAVHGGELWIERKLAAKLFHNDDQAHLRKGSGQENIEDCLTHREMEVLRLLANGGTNKEIGEALFISEKTVKSHLHSIFKKLNVSRRLQAILYALKQGIC
jgi:DNA-binding NarL/FixJ family response regulator